MHHHYLVCRRHTVRKFILKQAYPIDPNKYTHPPPRIIGLRRNCQDAALSCLVAGGSALAADKLTLDSPPIMHHHPSRSVIPSTAHWGPPLLPTLISFSFGER